MTDNTELGLNQDPGTLTFSEGSTEVLRFCPNGDIFTHGRKITTDEELYTVVKGFFMRAQTQTVEEMANVAAMTKKLQVLDEAISDILSRDAGPTKAAVMDLRDISKAPLESFLTEVPDSVREEARAALQQTSQNDSPE